MATWQAFVCAVSTVHKVILPVIMMCISRFVGNIPKKTCVVNETLGRVLHTHKFINFTQRFFFDFIISHYLKLKLV